MAWTVTIYRDSGSLELAANMRFDFPGIRKVIGENGDVLSIEYEFAIEGVLIDPTPATIGANMVTYSELVTSDVLTQRILIAQDGTTRWDLKPEDGFVGPYVTEFSSRKSEDGGTGKSKWHYSFGIQFSKKGGSTGGGETLKSIHTSTAVTTKNGKVVRKVWKATAEGTSSSSALSAVNSFKPSEKYITSEIEEFQRDNRASGVWIWDATTSDKGIKSWNCKVTAKGGDGWIDRPAAGEDADPVFYKKQRSKITIEVVGSIISNEKIIPVPPEHFTESETMHREPDQERRQRGTEIYGDPRNGEYRLEYHEVWSTSSKSPIPANHSGAHNEIMVGSAPEDGGVRR